MASSMHIVSKHLKSEKNVTIDAGACYTHVKMVKVTYTWTIGNFSMCRKDMVSSSFSGDGNDETNWALSAVDVGNPNIGIGLALVSSIKPEVNAKWKFAIIGSDEVKHWLPELPPHTFKFITDAMSIGPKSFFYGRLSPSNGRSMLPNDTLTIFCEITVVTDSVNISAEKNRTHLKVPVCQIASDYRRFLKSQMFTDITFKIGGKELPAHKTVLAARSAVFRAMFQNEMAEKLNNQVDISDIEYEIFEELLNYIYTGKVENLNKYAEGLLTVAEKYDLERLKTMSAAVLCKTLTVENVSHRLVLADFYRIQPLKDLAIDFIHTNTSEVTRTPSFELVAVTHPMLIAEMFRSSKERRKILIDGINRRKDVIHRVLQFPIYFSEICTLATIWWASVLICQHISQ